MIEGSRVWRLICTTALEDENWGTERRRIGFPFTTIFLKLYSALTK
jgi:hypothetical protein